jgi:hypothetical protein
MAHEQAIKWIFLGGSAADSPQLKRASLLAAVVIAVIAYNAAQILAPHASLLEFATTQVVVILILWLPCRTIAWWLIMRRQEASSPTRQGSGVVWVVLGAVGVILGVYCAIVYSVPDYYSAAMISSLIIPMNLIDGMSQRMLRVLGYVEFLLGGVCFAIFLYTGQPFSAAAAALLMLAAGFYLGRAGGERFGGPREEEKQNSA